MVYIAATNLDFLRASPGNWLELLKGDRKGDYRIRINDQWRICLKFANGIRQLIGALAGFRGSDCYISKGHGGMGASRGHLGAPVSQKCHQRCPRVE